MDYFNDSVFSSLDFIGGIDNEALDLDQFEAFIQNSNSSMNMHFFGNESNNSKNSVSIPSAITNTLPESPPDSGSERPYSVRQNEPNIMNGADIICLSDNSNNDLTPPIHSIFVQNNINNLTPLNVMQSQKSDFKTEFDSPSKTISLLSPVLTQVEQHTPIIPPTVSQPLIQNPECSIKLKKRKLSDSLNLPDSTSTNFHGSALSREGTIEDKCGESNSADIHEENVAIEIIKFTPFQRKQWHVLCDQNLQEIPPINYRISADKGFLHSASDDAYVCQKKNHFQVTCQIQLLGKGCFVRTASGLIKVRSFSLHFNGVKSELPEQRIRIEQSQTDRSKIPFLPVVVDLKLGVWTKLTIGRLHFAETTANNMRKKGRPNPDQRYFQLVISLHAATHSGTYPIISYGSEKIIVRASNPGLFENEMNSLANGINSNNYVNRNNNILNNNIKCNESNWRQGQHKDSLYHLGRIGINTDSPDESLVVHGNIKISGHIIQPSDSRAKEEISELDTAQQLENVQKIRVVRYRYNPDFTQLMNQGGNFDTSTDNQEYLRENIIDTGVLAQEIQKVLPDAVKEGGSILLPNGELIENFLLVNKDRIFMENIGAVKELCKVTGSLETRIEQLERINAHIQKWEKKRKFRNSNNILMSKKKSNKRNSYDEEDYGEDNYYIETCSNKVIQIIIIILVIVMAICLAAISTLYFIEHNHRLYNHFNADNLGSKISIRNMNLRNSSLDISELNDRDGSSDLNYPQQAYNRIESYDTRYTLKTIAIPISTVSTVPKTAATVQPPPSVGAEGSKIKKIQQNILKKKLEKDDENGLNPSDPDPETAGIEISRYKIFTNVATNNSPKSSNNSRNNSSANFYIDSDNFFSNAIDSQQYRDINKTQIIPDGIVAGIEGAPITTNHGTDNGYDLQNLAHNNGPIIDAVDDQLIDEDETNEDTGVILEQENIIVLPLIGEPFHCGTFNICRSVCCEPDIECNNTAKSTSLLTASVFVENMNTSDSVEASTSKYSDSIKTTTSLEQHILQDNDDRPLDIFDERLLITTPLIKLNSQSKPTSSNSTNENNSSVLPTNCLSISMSIFSSYNTTVKENLICDDIDIPDAVNRNFHNLTFSIEISRYLFENSIKLSFETFPLSRKIEWFQCQPTTLQQQNNINITDMTNISKSATFLVDFPQFHSFERLYMFRALFSKSANSTPAIADKEICQSYASLGGFLQYNLRFFRKCD